jgi:hypothetical protein
MNHFAPRQDRQGLAGCVLKDLPQSVFAISKDYSAAAAL